jgi:hypothetical protein
VGVSREANWRFARLTDNRKIALQGPLEWREFVLWAHNLTPEAGYSDFMKPGRFWRYQFRFSGIDPERLTETGRAHPKRAINTERIIFAFMISGFALFASVSSYLRA